MSSPFFLSPVLALVAATQIGGCQPIQKVIADSKADKARMEELNKQSFELDAKIQSLRSRLPPDVYNPQVAAQHTQAARLDLERLEERLNTEADTFEAAEKQLAALRQEVETLRGAAR